MAALHMDLITVILERLPVRSLLRFRCVSKEWRNTIDSPLFAESYLSMTVESSTRLGLFLWESSSRSSSLYRIDLGSLRGVVSIDHPFSGSPRSGSRQVKVLGSCNGLLCISDEADRVVIWNPSTGNHKFLSHAPVEVRRPLDFYSVWVYGLGHDDENDDYLLLRLYRLETEPTGSEVRIYSLKINAWKRLHDMPYFLYYVHKMGIFACGHLHWIMTREPPMSDSAKMLVAFDFRIEDFRVVDLPDVIDDQLDMDIAVLGGCLCLSVNNNHMGVNVWIMKEYGLKQS